MRATVRYVAIALAATAAIACGAWYDTANRDFGSDAAYTSEAVGTSGSFDQEITISGCVARMPHDQYVLTDVDAEDTPLSAETGRYRLTGKSDQFVARVDREVEVKGFVVSDRSGTADTLRVVSMRTTGRKCSKE